jgi:hypothetical protein
MNVYISSSWKNRDQVRELALALRDAGHKVYDFTDPKCRPEQFDPDRHDYCDYLKNSERRHEANCNKKSIHACDVVVLLLPAGDDAIAGAYYALGRGKRLIVCGHPVKGERSPTHLWADWIVEEQTDAVKAVVYIEKTMAMEVFQ